MIEPAGYLGLSRQLPDGRKPRIVLFGAPHGSSYPDADAESHAQAAMAIRTASAEDADLIDNWDFDLDGPLFADQTVCCVDIGDLPTSSGANAQNRSLIEKTTRDVLASGAVPIMIGGDDSTPIPFISGYSGSGPIWILQIDAHIDWLEERQGERFGYSSPMRRASEMAHVEGIVQVGIRAVGSARSSDLQAAERYGAKIVTARHFHAHGAEDAVQHIPEDARILITLDCDGFDPGIMPGVAARTPGGLSYFQTVELIEAAARRGHIAGFDLVELYPPADVDGISALTASRILVNVIGRLVRQP